MPRLYSYVVARDFGFAPNPFFGVCTLATCKPRIRVAASVGDWVIGTGTATRGLPDHLIFAMQISEALTYDKYWRDPRFVEKQPHLRGSKKQAFGDNIYHYDFEHSAWHQCDSHHSLPDGTANIGNIEHDTQTDRVLIGERFVYFGRDAPMLPQRYRNADDWDVRATRNHRSRFSAELVDDIVDWICSFEEFGFLGPPSDWDRTE